MNAVRRGLLLCAVATTIFGAAACGTDSPVTPYDAVAANQQPAQRPDVDAGIITALSDTSVTWTDGEIVPADSGPGYTIRLLTGADRRHTAPLAKDVKLFLPFDAEGVAQLDKDKLGTVACTDRDQFKEHVLDTTMTAPRITFDRAGNVTRMAARYQA